MTYDAAPLHRLLVAALLATATLASPAAAQTKISDTAGNFGGTLNNYSQFGTALAYLGDLDGDGREEVAVGAPGRAGPGGVAFGQGVVWILSLESDGSVGAEQLIAPGVGGFTYTNGTGYTGSPNTQLGHTRFGASVAALGDLDGDGVGDLAVGAPLDDDSPWRGYSSFNLPNTTGAVFILFLHADGTVKAQRKIREGMSGFTTRLDHDSRFGSSVAALGDLDGDGLTELAVGAERDIQKLNGSSTTGGAVHVLFLDSDGTVQSDAVIRNAPGGTGEPDWSPSDRFGCSVASVGDLDYDGVPDLAAGACQDDDGQLPGGKDEHDAGAIWVLLMEPDGSVKSGQKISQTQGGFTAGLSKGNRFGTALADLGDLDGNGRHELAVGTNAQTVFVLYLNANRTVNSYQRLDDQSHPAVQGSGGFGRSAALIGQASVGATHRLGVGAHQDDDGGWDRGAVWISSWDPYLSWIRFLDNLRCWVGDRCVVELETHDDLVYTGPLRWYVYFNVRGEAVEMEVEGDEKGDMRGGQQYRYEVYIPREAAERDGDLTLVLELAPEKGAEVLRFSTVIDRQADEHTASKSSGLDAARPGETSPGLPARFALHAAYPNPFNPATTIAFTLDEAGPVTLKVYDVYGREVATVADGAYGAGRHEVRFEAGALASGTYLYALRAGRFQATRRMVLLK